jgi:hypothetical protein
LIAILTRLSCQVAGIAQRCQVSQSVGGSPIAIECAKRLDVMNVKMASQVGFRLAAFLALVAVAFASVPTLLQPVRAIVQIAATSPVRAICASIEGAHIFTLALSGAISRVISVLQPGARTLKGLATNRTFSPDLTAGIVAAAKRAFARRISAFLRTEALAFGVGLQAFIGLAAPLASTGLSLTLPIVGVAVGVGNPAIIRAITMRVVLVARRVDIEELRTGCTVAIGAASCRFHYGYYIPKCGGVQWPR